MGEEIFDFVPDSGEGGDELEPAGESLEDLLQEMEESGAQNTGSLDDLEAEFGDGAGSLDALEAELGGEEPGPHDPAPDRDCQAADERR